MNRVKVYTFGYSLALTVKFFGLIYSWFGCLLQALSSLLLSFAYLSPGQEGIMSYSGNEWYDEPYHPYGYNTQYNQSRDSHYYHDDRLSDRYNDWNHHYDEDRWGYEGGDRQDG